MTKIIIALVIIALLGAGFFFLKMHRQNTVSNTSNNNTQTVTPSSKPTFSPMTSSSPTTDKALDQKFQDVQGSLNKLDTDQKAANQDSSSQDTPGNY